MSTFLCCWCSWGLELEVTGGPGPVPRGPLAWVRSVAAGLRKSPSERTLTLLAAAEAGQGYGYTAGCACISSAQGRVLQQIPTQIPLQPSTSEIIKHFWVAGSVFPWENWRAGAASEVQWMCHSHRRAFRLLSWARGGNMAHTGWVWYRHQVLSTNVSLQAPSPIDPQYLVMRKPYGRVPPPQPPACPPQPLLSLPVKVRTVTGSLKQPENMGYILSWAELLVWQHRECSILPWTQERTAQSWGRAITILVLLRVCRNSFFLSAWQEAVTCFRNTFSHQCPFSYLVRLLGVFEVKSVNLGKIKTPLTTDTWSSIAVQRLLSNVRYYIPHSSVTWSHDPIMRVKVF